MHTAITGASGLVGGNLAVALRAEGHDVRATRRGTSKVAQLDGHAIEWVSADLADRDALTKAFRDVDVVFHCAAQVSILSTATPALVSANVDGTRNVIEAAPRRGGPSSRTLLHRGRDWPLRGRPAER